MDNKIEPLKVGIADLKIAFSPQPIKTTGLGSCVGIIIYDPILKIAGLAHIMLPDSSIMKKGTEFNKSKFADTAVKELVQMLNREGCKNRELKAKIAGGAEMFSFSVNETMRIGKRNIDAVKKALKEEAIAIISEDTGGNNGRTIVFDPEKCMLEIRTVNKGIAFI
ncbi:chemotaxis protein CheD [Heyndrickxia acidicola]|uniref:Probable chemoreceptor glutamine deamidase CheD n=1 Tax=Heyndrickxia acidicola TaxID=209389 RepID=A0ABU6MG81_9BACI|nr:chemotaxis protein CheD [Heyndrickxia acidicola]MED1202050.1 chemotaxis protein CheD [Heyndrickxia acidicola]